VFGPFFAFQWIGRASSGSPMTEEKVQLQSEF
jgi:hypothetical protein